MFDVARTETGAIAADSDNFVVAKLMDFLDRIFQTRREIVAILSMDLRSAWHETTAGSKEMNIRPRREFWAELGRI
jgi:hypothetical protein